MSKSFGEVLKSFKSKETPECIVPLIDDVGLRNGLVAWRAVPITFKKPSDCAETDESKQWNWLWNQIEMDVATFGIVSGIKNSWEANNLFIRLKGLRLIYADGSINELAKMFLQSMVMKQMPKRKQREPEAE